MENVIFTNKDQIEQIKKKMAQDGPEKIHILADFDRTLTKSHIDGKKVPSLISVLRDEEYLTPDYPEKAHKLFEKYNAIEENTSISEEEKKKAMREWWTKHFELLIQSGLSRKDIEQAVQSHAIQFREGFDEFLDFLKKHNIPLVIISSSGLGQESIKAHLRYTEKEYQRLYIVSNSYQWDEQGKAIAVNEPIVHTMNKDETVLKDFSFYNKIKEKTNVLLLGDSLSDVNMIHGFNYTNLIKIGFLNEKVEERKEAYQGKYDIIIPNNGELTFLNNFLKDIVG